MSYIIQRIYEARSIFRASRNLKWVQVPPVSPDTVSVIYHRRPPPWARFGGVLIALNVMMVSSIVEYTWDFSGIASRNKVAPVEPAETVDSEVETVPEHLADRVRAQPFGKKVLFSGVYAITGAGLIAALLATRTRLLRTVTLARAGPGPNAKRSGTLYFQTAAHPVGYGIAFPLKDCSIVKSEVPSKLFLRVTGLGVWILNVNGATINGKTMPKDQIEVSRVAMLRAWNAIGGGVVVPAAKT